MINISLTFLHEYYNTAKGFPGDVDTNINHPQIKLADKKATAAYVDKNIFLILFSLLNCTNIEEEIILSYRLTINGVIAAKFAENNLQKKIYRDTRDETKNMKEKVTRFIDLCRQHMKNDLEQELDDEIKLFESTEEAADKKTLEYHYDLWETVKNLMTIFVSYFLI